MYSSHQHLFILSVALWIQQSFLNSKTPHSIWVTLCQTMHVHRVIYWERIASVWLWQNCTFPQFRTKPPLRPERARPIQVDYCPVASLLGACAEAEQQATDRPAVEPKTVCSLIDNWFWVHMQLWKTCQWLCSPDSLQSVWKSPVTLEYLGVDTAEAHSAAHSK